VNAEPSAEDVRGQLGRVLASDGFANADRISRFLRYVVERTLAGEADRLKEYAIGVDVFDRKEEYDPRIDSIVRVEAARLRSKLDEYYNRAGTDDPILIRLRRGSYIPVFEQRSPGDSNESAARQIQPSPPSSARWSLGLGLVAGICIVLGALAWRTAPWAANREPPAVRIAVLPLAAFSGVPADDQLAARLTDGITTELARLNTVAVVSHTSAVQFAGVRKPLREIAHALNAALIVEGSVLTKGERVQVDARVVDAVADRKIWVKDFEASVSDLASLQRDIAIAVASAVQNRTRSGP
jgi:TolB-like protein